MYACLRWSLYCYFSHNTFKRLMYNPHPKLTGIQGYPVHGLHTMSLQIFPYINTRSSKTDTI